MFGLVLEGGGAKGAYQIGAWKALRELGIDIKGVSGTSVGALNGAMVVQGDFDRAYDLWYNIKPSKVINIDDELLHKFKKLDFTSDDVRNLLAHLKILMDDKGIDISPLKNLLNENVDEDKIRGSGKDFGMVTVSFTDMKPLELFLEDIPKGLLVDYLLASSSLPVFKQEKMEGKIYLDGGFYNNAPINLLKSKGYKNLIVVGLNGIGRKLKVDAEGLNITYIEPSEELARTLDFSQDEARKSLKLGYFDTLKVFNKLKGSKYYIESNEDEDYYTNYFLNLDKNKVVKIGEMLGIEDMSYRRMLFEHIIPRIADILGIDEDKGYEDILLALYEEVAIRNDIERFKVYKFDEFRDIVMNKSASVNTVFSRSLPKIFIQSNLILKTMEKDILNAVINEMIAS